MKVYFLVGMFAVVVAGYIAGDNHHGDAIKGGIGNAGGRIGHSRTQMTEHHRSPAGNPRIPVGRMSGNLLVADIDKFYTALFKS